MLRYAITDGTLSAEGEAMQRKASSLAERWAADGMDYVQIREKTLSPAALLACTVSMAAVFHAHGGQTRLLVNGRPDVAILAGADGIHLTAHPDELTPQQARQVFSAAGIENPVISISTHTLAEVDRALDLGADLILFGPVFEKRIEDTVVVEGSGLEILHQACLLAGKMPLLALGGVTQENAPQCLRAGAAGIAGIRFFA